MEDKRKTLGKGGKVKGNKRRYKLGVVYSSEEDEDKDKEEINCGKGKEE